MHKEFAIDPSLISTWERMRFVAACTGFDRGRLIAEFPKQWAVRVRQAASGETEINAARITQRLEEMWERKVLSRRDGTEWDTKLSWLANAKAEDARCQQYGFDGIVSESRDDHHKVVEFDALDDSPIWSCPTAIECARKAKPIADCARKLLALSSEIVFVEPHFRPEEKRYVRPLEQCLKAAIENRRASAPLRRLEVHLDGRKWQGAQEFKRKLTDTNRLTRIIPKSQRIVFKLLLDGSKQMHDRFILTELGAMNFGHGIEVGTSTVNVSLVDRTMHLQLWDDHVKCTKQPPAFRLLDDRPIDLNGCG